MEEVEEEPVVIRTGGDTGGKRMQATIRPCQLTTIRVGGLWQNGSIQVNNGLVAVK